MSCHESSSSSDCDACCNKKCCESSCSKRSCHVDLPSACNPGQIACKTRDAVVSVLAQYVFLGSGSTGATATTAPTPTTGLGGGLRADLFVRGNGFFLPNGWIAVPASVVFAPPSLSGLAQRWPYMDPTYTAVGQVQNRMIRASQILVGVNNVNNTGKDYVYVANVVGVDGAGDIAFLALDYPCGNSTKSNPKVKVKGKKACHPHIPFADKCYKPQEGETVYLVGSYTSNLIPAYGYAQGAVLTGVVSDPHYIDPLGVLTYEALLVSCSVYTTSVGMPILNGHGHLLGMQTTNVCGTLNSNNSDDSLNVIPSGMGYVGGATAKSIRRDWKILCDQSKKSCCDECKVENVRDPAGPYYRILKGYLGIAYNLTSLANSTYTMNFTSGEGYSANEFFARVRINSDGSIGGLPRDSQFTGITVVGLAGLNGSDSLAGVTGGAWYVPGGTGVAPLVTWAPTSPLIGRIQPGDQILSIAKCNGRGSKTVKLGAGEGEWAPSALLWRLGTCDEVELSYVSTGQYVSNTGSNSPTGTVCCTDCKTTKATVLQMPAVIDYPWYAISQWQLLSEFGFVAVNNLQLLAPQTPSLVEGAPFHTAV